jgi:peptidoglycan/LPS O-acetylase OafA/YrhL
MNRMAQLDGLRALAVLGVILHHAVKWDIFLPLGPYSVRLFFVLSGFLITGILLRARAKTDDRGHVLWAFYMRRFLRIFPIYYVSLAALWLLGQPEIRSTILWHLSYTSNVLAANPAVDIPSIWGHLWSLSVEEQFYLVWPAIVLFLPQRWVPRAFVAAIVAGPVFRLAVSEFWHFKPALYLTPGCLDSLGLGALLAWMMEQTGWETFRRTFTRTSLVVGLAMVAATLVFGQLDSGYRFRFAFSDTGVSLCSVWLVNGAVNRFGGVLGKILDLRLLGFLGMISYGLYLLHNFVPFLADLAGYPLPSHGIVRFVALTAITVPLAAISWYCFEGPLNQLKDLFPYQPAGAAPKAQESAVCS